MDREGHKCFVDHLVGDSKRLLESGRSSFIPSPSQRRHRYARDWRYNGRHVQPCTEQESWRHSYILDSIRPRHNNSTWWECVPPYVLYHQCLTGIHRLLPQDCLVLLSYDLKGILTKKKKLTRMIDAVRLIFSYSVISLVVVDGSLCRYSECSAMATWFAAMSPRTASFRGCRGYRRGFSTSLGTPKFFHDCTMELGTTFSKFDYDRTKFRVRDGGNGSTHSGRGFNSRISRGAAWVRRIRVEAWELWGQIQHGHIWLRASGLSEIFDNVKAAWTGCRERKRECLVKC